MTFAERLLTSVTAINVTGVAAAFATPGFGDFEATGFGMPEQASTVAGEIDGVYNFITILSIVFFVLIVGAMLIFIVMFRRGSGDSVRTAEKTSTHNTPLEVTWTVVPLLLAIAIFYVGMKGYLNLRQPPGNAYEIDVVAKRWNWEFTYTNDEAGSVTIPHELYVPVDRPIKLNMMSLDVLHSCYVPAFRVKQDVVPGRFTHLWFTATEVGSYTLFCTEYCGTDHSNMIATVHVVPQEDFESILAEKGNWIKDVPEINLKWAGAKVYSSRGCTQCHSLDGSSGIGPSFRELHELWGRNRVFADGSEAVVDENYIINSIRNPNGQIVSGYNAAMPAQNLKMREMVAVARFVKSLDTVTDESGTLMPIPDGSLEGSGAGTDDGASSEASAE